MSNESSGGTDLVKNSSLYKEFQAELAEILRQSPVDARLDLSIVIAFKNYK